MRHRRTIYDHPRGFATRAKTQKAELAHGPTSIAGWDDRNREIFRRLAQKEYRDNRGAR